MKHYIFLLLTLFLVACAEKDLSGDGRPVGPRTGLRLSARLGQGTLTRAVGDPFASGKEEKRIDRLAFFVHTAEDGFQVYPPAPDDGSTTIDDDPYSVHLKETATDSRQYTADVVLTGGGGYVADIIAVANLPKDYDYNQIVSWQGLQDSVLVWTTEMPSCTPGTDITDADRRAFVMYGYVRHELEKESTNALSLAMERLVARIDITNEAYVQGMTLADPKGGFQLSSVRLLRARPASYLVPQMDYASPDVQTVSDWTVTDIPFGKPTSATVDANPTREPDLVPDAQASAQATLQYLWHTLYTYENSDTEHAPTALEIKGLFRGMEVTRQIPFIDKDNQPLPIVRNHRYLVRILPAPGLTDITYDVKIAEWDAVDTVNVKPDQTAVPVIENLETDRATVFVNAEGQKVYDYYYTQDGTISFDATCNFAPDVRVKYEEPKQGDWITIEKSEPELITKSSKMYKRSFKITFPKMDSKGIRHATLLVHNGGSEVECDTIRIRHTLYYPGTDLEGIAVEKDGKTTIWAPVNCGATRLPTKIYEPNGALTPDQLKSNQEQQGNLYQWGRKVPFKPLIRGQYADYVKLLNDYQNLPTYEESIVPGYCDDKFVLTASPFGCWFLWKNFDDPDFSPTIHAAGNTWPRQNDPCPKGWRIANEEEWRIIIEKMKSDKFNTDKRIWEASLIPGFVVPESTFIDPTGQHLLYACFFASSYNTKGANAIGVMFSSGSIGDSKSVLRYSSGASIRCVSE